ncbi:MAG: DNA-directed RNA polymerase specialized sigma24 family protein [Candidatus Aldehydirespiratoraceae bacterium]|jgi:DNA-directed RNA polymerase specialized sigma24 family protein
MNGEFDDFVKEVEPVLRRALTGCMPRDQVHDGLSEAFAFAWENWDDVAEMEHPVGYLYRVAQSKTRSRKQGFLPWMGDSDIPEVEPELIPALEALPANQKTAVWLVTACGWSQVDAAEAMGVAPSTVSTHVARGLESIRTTLGASA